MTNPIFSLSPEDSHLIDMLNDVTYFNLEISPSFKSLVFNASKKGIDEFLKVYGHLKTPPEVLDFTKYQRPMRKWLSPNIELNKQIENTDATPYGMIYGWDTKNHLVPDLEIKFILQNDSLVLSPAMNEEKPYLIVNQKGWETFLTLIRSLRDKSYWFFLTKPNPLYIGRPFFHLNPVDSSKDHQFEAMEFIRLEPVESGEIYLKTYNEILGNCTGLLLLSHWMKEFAQSTEESKDFSIRWNNFPIHLLEESEIPEFSKRKTLSPIWIYFRKIKLPSSSPLSSFPLFSFERKKGEEETGSFYIFGNSKGFEELSEIVEYFAFLSDHDEFYPSPLKNRHWGDTIENGLGPEGLIKGGWAIVGGGYLSPKYNPLRFIKTPTNPSRFETEEKIERNFINERVLFLDV